MRWRVQWRGCEMVKLEARTALLLKYWRMGGCDGRLAVGGDSGSVDIWLCTYLRTGRMECWYPYTRRMIRFTITIGVSPYCPSPAKCSPWWSSAGFRSSLNRSSCKPSAVSDLATAQLTRFGWPGKLWRGPLSMILSGPLHNLLLYTFMDTGHTVCLWPCVWEQSWPPTHDRYARIGNDH